LTKGDGRLYRIEKMNREHSFVIISIPDITTGRIPLVKAELLQVMKAGYVGVRKV